MVAGHHAFDGLLKPLDRQSATMALPLSSRSGERSCKTAIPSRRPRYTFRRAWLNGAADASAQSDARHVACRSKILSNCVNEVQFTRALNGFRLSLQAQSESLTVIQLREDTKHSRNLVTAGERYGASGYLHGALAIH